MGTPSHLAAIDRESSPTVADDVRARVPNASPYHFLPLIALDVDDDTARAVAAIPGVIGVAAIPRDAIDARGVVDGIDILLGVADAQRTGGVGGDLYGGTAAGDPYPVVRPGTPPVIDTDPDLSLATPPAAMVAVNLSLGPTSVDYPAMPADPVNLASLALAQNQLVVMAAGNSGTGVTETMSAWAEMPWVLAVGSTEDAEGRRLAATSSRGIAGRPDSGPDLVAHGVSAVAPHPTGTSFAAPQITRFALLIAAALFQARHAWPGAAPADEGVRLVGAGIIDSGFEQLRREVIPTAALPVVGADSAGIQEIADIAGGAGLTLDVSGSPNRVRRLLLAAARPVPGCAPHEVGAGFVDEGGVIRQLAGLTGADAIALFCDRIPDPRVTTALERHRLFDPDELATLAAVVRVTSPLWAYDYQQQRLGRVP